MNTLHGSTSSGFALVGELDVATVEPLRERFRAARGTGQVDFEVDLAGVTFMDCASLRALLWCRREARRAGGGLVVKEASAVARRLISLTGTGDLLQPPVV